MLKKIILFVVFLIFISCSSDNSVQPTEICHYETICNDTHTGGFRDHHSGCRTPYQKQVCEEIHY